MVEVMRVKKRYACGHDDEPKQEFSSGGFASGNSSNSVSSVFSLSAPSFGSAFVPSNGSTVNITSTAPSKSNITSGPQGKSQAPKLTTPLQASLGFGPFSAQNNIRKASSSGGSGFVCNGSQAPPVPVFDFLNTHPGNTAPFGMETAKTGWFPPEHCYVNAAMPAQRFPIFQPAHASQTTLPPFTSKATSERDAEKHLFFNGNEAFMRNSQKCKKCGGKAPESKQGPFDKHLPVSKTMDIPTQLKQGEYQCICSKLSGDGAIHGSRMALSCLLLFTPVTMVPVIPIFNGAFRAVPEIACSGSVPGTFMYPETAPLFCIGYNLCGKPTVSRENAMPSFYMQPSASAGVIPLPEMFGHIHV